MGARITGTTSNGDPVVSGIGDTEQSGRDAIYDLSAYDDDGVGSDIHNGDVEGGEWSRKLLWQRDRNPSYDGEAALPSDDTGRRGREDKEWRVAWAADQFGVTDDVLIGEAQSLAVETSGRGHSIVKLSVGALIVAQDRTIAERAARADTDPTIEEIAERAAETESDRERNTALNLIEESGELESLFARRLHSREDVVDLAEEHGFEIARAVGIYHG